MAREDELASIARQRDAALAAPPPGPYPVHIYGAGGFGRRVGRALTEAGRTVAGFIDVRADAIESVDGWPCRHPEALDDDAVRGCAFALGVLNPDQDTRAIADWATARGFAETLFPADLHRIPGLVLDHYWLGPPARMREDWAAITRLHAMLDDDESRRLLETLLRLRLSGDPRLHPAVEAADFYRPAFLPIRDRPLTFIDGGAFTGDTLEALLDDGIAVADWIAFEPDARNMTVLIETAARHRARLPAYTLMALGLSDRGGRAGFSAGIGSSSHILGPDLDGGGETIAVARLDDLVRRQGHLYVKLDIEGAEPAALRGMPLLLRQRPLMAVSVYHAPDHLWTIPLLVAELFRRPRLRLRQHGRNGFETVLYVMPQA